MYTPKTRSERIKAAIYLAIALVLLANLARLSMQQHVRAQSATPPGPGYTVVLQEAVTDSKGVVHRGSTSLEAVRADGSRVIRLGPGEADGRIIEIGDIRVSTVGTKKMKSTMRISQGGPSWRLDPKTNCTRSIDEPPPAAGTNSRREYLGTEQIAGFRTAKVRSSSIIRWHALDHACAVVRSKMDSGAQGSSENTLVALTPGEPDPKLFIIPADYQEVSPSATLAGPPAECGADCQARNKAIRDKMDEHYQSHRAKLN